MSADGHEIEALETTLAWRLRCLDADPGDAVSARAVGLLETLIADLRQADVGPLWIELAAEYRRGIGVSADPTSGAAYLRGLRDLAESLI